MSQTKDYKESLKSLKEQQANMSYDEVKELMLQNSEHVLELDKIQPQNHNWVDRGQVMSCENAGHPNHRAFKTMKRGV